MAAGFAFVSAGDHSRQQVSERPTAPKKAKPRTTFHRDRMPVSNNLTQRPRNLRNFSFEVFARPQTFWHSQKNNAAQLDGVI